MAAPFAAIGETGRSAVLARGGMSLQTDNDQAIPDKTSFASSPVISGGAATGDTSVKQLAASGCVARMVFDEEIGFDIMEQIPPGTRVLMRSVGDSLDQDIASGIQIFLEKNGYDVIRVISSSMAPKPRQRIEIQREEYSNLLIVAPSADCVGSSLGRK